jgi:hypothetical protein
MPASESRSSIWRFLGILICGLVLGLPMALVFTHGMILIPLLIVAVLAPFVAAHYLLWGWWLSPRQDVIMRQTDLSDFSNMPFPTGHAEGIRSKEQGESYFR